MKSTTVAVTIRNKDNLRASENEAASLLFQVSLLALPLAPGQPGGSTLLWRFTVRLAIHPFKFQTWALAPITRVVAGLWVLLDGTRVFEAHNGPLEGMEAFTMHMCSVWGNDAIGDMIRR